MRLCTIKTETIPATFGVELKHKILRVAAAADLYELTDSDKAKIATAMDYFQNLPSSEKVMRNLLKQISEEPKKLARPATDGAPCFLAQKDVEYLPPIEKPGKILCVGMNYRDHCEEQDCPIPKKPLIFNKFTTSLRGHGTSIPLPLKVDECADYEGEFVVVIGKKAKRVTKRSAMKNVGGYSIMNDVSLRTIQRKEKQWARAKGFDGSGPFGPVIVTPDEIPDPLNLGITTMVNGKVRQKSNTKNLIFPIAELISFISQLITLEPGDVITTGTPGGVGVYSDPPLFLKDGDNVEIRIDRIGSLRNTCVKG